MAQFLYGGISTMNNEPDYHNNLYFEDKKMKKQTQTQPFFISLAKELQRLLGKARCDAYFDGMRDGLKSLKKTLELAQKQGEHFTTDDFINICIPENIKATEECRQEALKEYEKREAIN